MGLSLRQSRLLDFIIREYVKRAEPIPSALVCRKSSGLHVSSATVRKEMNHLEDRGYLEQRHVSGGRVPTDKAYRYFVNNLLAPEKSLIEPREQRKIQTSLARADNNPQLLCKMIAQVLSDLSDNLVITGIEPSLQARPETGDFFKIGLTSLFEMPEFKQFDRMFQLTSFFEDFDNIFDSFARDLMGEFGRDVQAGRGWINIFIGRENPFGQVKDETMMVAKYPLPGRLRGSLALIGPTRMDYEKNIALIKYTVDSLGRM
ncbi:MAG: Transcriptional regulator of heat shock protein [Candidatus Yanofskybacteria bacterium GW2011_GWA1_48_10]|uniref:Heat-inducible transcription repressor HrcA n=2 Tax=Candidatus Yanofskyibacteriota TaxID=1752733 RepID=A0A0G1X544_9BACT|nr:MAG: Transcriptional regulator of heat shock protein [Candidatus Yanofskybacteria bacterium GW2011_GWA1_48_10]OGN06565.1 MAG: hypothetical protein A2669_02895 [Candidatus Yanofskybacteria bacterium RIFCSPHIGHO2_01_FULL_48_25b]